QELQENPVLELKEATGDEPTVDGEATPEAAPSEDATNPETELVIDETGDKESDFDRMEAFERDWEDRYNEEHRPSRNGLDEEGNKKHDAMQNMPARPQSLQEYLDDQLTFMDCTRDQLLLCRFLITHINENGYLKVSTEEIAKSYEQPISVAQVE